MLGEIAVESAIGQPLSARVPVMLSADELLMAGCVSAVSGAATDINQVPAPVVSVPNAATAGAHELRITTTQPLHEPMYELQLQVRCPGATPLLRQYLLMLDLPGALKPATPEPVEAAIPETADDAAASSATGAALPEPAATPQAGERTTARSHEPIAAGATYRVQAGDTLFGISRRVTNRGGASVQEFSQRIFAANHDAFIAARPDLIKLGSTILIPNAASAQDIAVAAGDQSTTAMQQPVVEAPAAVDLIVEADVATPAPGETVSAAQAGDTPGTAASTDDSVAAASAAAAVSSRIATPATPKIPTVAVQASASSPGRDEEAPKWLAVLMGLLMGTGAGAVMWRDRLMNVLRRPTFLSRGKTDEFTPAAAKPALPAALVIREPRASESAMVVVESAAVDTEVLRAAQEWSGSTARQDPVLDEAETSPAEPTVIAKPDDDLSMLFAMDPDARSGEPHDNATLEAYSLDDLDLDLSTASAITDVDQDITDSDAEDLALSPYSTATAESVSASGNDTADHLLDLNAMAQMAPEDARLADTLREALELLESDYEDELSSSQRLDTTRLAQDIEQNGTALSRTGTDRMPRP
jgi:hypothetical protein